MYPCNTAGGLWCCGSIEVNFYRMIYNQWVPNMIIETSY